MFLAFLISLRGMLLEVFTHDALCKLDASRSRFAQCVLMLSASDHAWNNAVHLQATVPYKPQCLQRTQSLLLGHVMACGEHRRSVCFCCHSSACDCPVVWILSKCLIQRVLFDMLTRVSSRLWNEFGFRIRTELLTISERALNVLGLGISASQRWWL